MLLFTRHVGCPFGERMLERFGAAVRRRPGVEYVAVLNGERRAAMDWQETTDLAEFDCRVERVADLSDGVYRPESAREADVTVLVDEDRALYEAWGLDVAGLAHLLDVRVTANLLETYHDGYLEGETVSGSRWQRAGVFAVDAEDTVRAAQTAELAHDLPDPAAALTFLPGADGASAAGD